MYTDMDFWTKIRLELLRGETSKREVLRREGIHWETLKKIIQYSEPPGYRIENRCPKPKIGPFLVQIEQIGLPPLTERQDETRAAISPFNFHATLCTGGKSGE